jgi:phosphomannomutase/phosphomannomutase/phosphoglucomutase
MSYQEKDIESFVFRAYDIRGIVNEQFNEDAFYTIGRAISCRLKDLNRNSIFVARDARLTSESLAKALRAGLLDSGIRVIDLGAVPTPVMYFAAHTEEIDSGLMITGSHNPADYNGIKIVLAGKTLIQSDIDELYKLVQAKNFINGQGTLVQNCIISKYKARVIQDLRLARPLTVVVDCGNGIAGNIIPEVLSNLGCKVIPLYCEVDGNFPNHHPDPSVEANLEDLKAAVLAHQADIGLAFDGDADRLGVVTDLGKVIWPDRLIMYYAQSILKRLPGATIVFDVKCSSHVSKSIESAGGIAKMCPTGHSIVKSIMKTYQAVLAGEMSGHLFFKDGWYGFDDALYSACRLLDLLSQSALSISEQFSQIPESFHTPEIKIPIDEQIKFKFMQRFIEQADFMGANIVRIDGLRAEFEKGWGLLRASNTTPCLIARFEAEDIFGLEEIKQKFKEQLLKLDSTFCLPF